MALGNIYNIPLDSLWRLLHLFGAQGEAQEEPKEMEDKEEGGEGGTGWTLACWL